MTTPTKTTAQQRADQIHAFKHELAELTREQVLNLTDEQQATIEHYHQGLFDQFRSAFDIDSSQQQKQLSLGMRIASFLGALALAASVFFLFYQFWGRLGTTSQVIILSGASIFSFVATVIVASKDGSGYFTKLIGLVAFACFVLNIALFGQIFNITPSDNALLAWAALALLLAYAYDVRLLQVAGVLCIIAFASARVGAWSGMYWIHFGERPENFFPIAIVLFLIPQWIDHQRFSGFALSYRVFGIVTLLTPMLVLAHWGYGSYLNIDPDIIEGSYQVAGFIISAALVGYGIRRGWGHVVNTGVTFFVIFLYTKFFDWWWDVMPKYLFFLILGLTAILCLFIFKRLRQGEPATEPAQAQAETGRTQG
ncbi:MAG: DUF2157 domain-containing protein [Gammaproteobacteria bacterium]|nr:DUF2157 domain-containing protein [Gammaproteobacteria bacterium]